MKIAIGGIGEIGESICKSLYKFKHYIVGFDINRELLCEKSDIYAINFKTGDISSSQFLIENNISNFDYYIAATNNLSTNLCSASIAKSMGCRFVIARINSDIETSPKLFNLQKHFNIDLIFDPNNLCAFEIAKIIRGIERTTIENFTRHRIEARRFIAKKRSNFINRPLAKLDISSSLRIINISRDNYNEIPNGNSIILPGDNITVTGTSDDLERLRNKLSDNTTKEIGTKVVIFGQKKITSDLVKFLSETKYKITLLEKNRQICEEFSERFSNIEILNGDCTSLTFLQEEGICNCEYFIAFSSNDELNIICAIQAKYLGARHTIVLLNSKNYEPLLRSMHKKFGIDHIISKHQASVNEISNFVTDKPFNEILKIDDQNISFIEFRIEKTSRAIGKKIKDLGLPRNCMIISLIHDFVAQVPYGDNEIQYDDRIICSTTQEALRSLIGVFVD